MGKWERAEVGEEHCCGVKRQGQDTRDLGQGGWQGLGDALRGKVSGGHQQRS